MSDLKLKVGPVAVESHNDSRDCVVVLHVSFQSPPEYVSTPL